MSEHVYQVDTFATLVTLAKTLGFSGVDSQGKDYVKFNGAIVSGGSYFLNHIGKVYRPTGNMVAGFRGTQVPEVAALPGEWGRLRLNGDTNFMVGLKQAIAALNASMTIYIHIPGANFGDPGTWVIEDTTTPAPSYVPSIGVIA
jgi:hypothetical protein